jgi:hypothetical protein
VSSALIVLELSLMVQSLEISSTKTRFGLDKILGIRLGE